MFHYEQQNQTKDVLLYLRQSTDEKDGKQVRSIHDQQENCLQLAQHLGLNIVQIFREERSARHPHNRPIFKQMLKALKYKNPRRRIADGVLSWAPDRLSRNALESGMIMQMLDDDLIKNLFFCAYRFHNDPSGMEHLAIEFARAKGYVDRLSQNVLRGTISREKEGAMLRPAKFGYTKKREDIRNAKNSSLFPIPCPDTFPVIRDIFLYRLKGMEVPKIKKQINANYPEFKKINFSRSAIYKWLNDSFYCGIWVINKGKKNERIVELNTLASPDGTLFTPVVTVEEFHRCQSDQKVKKISQQKNHVNPIACPLVCAHCQNFLRPARRPIKRAGGIREVQLGYECQYKSEDGTSCQQSRIKAEALFQLVQGLMKEISVDRKLHAQYSIGLNKFMKSKSEELRRSKIKLSKQVSTLQTEQDNLIRQKATLAENNNLTCEEKKWFEKNMNRVQSDLLAAKVEYQSINSEAKSKLKSFSRFIEPLKNLHQHWEKADPAKKRLISEKLGLNLVIKDQEIQSVSWKKPFDELFSSNDFLNGGETDSSIEPYFSLVWTVFESMDDEFDWEFNTDSDQTETIAFSG